MMSSLVYGLDICVQGGDVRVSTGRCFIFVMKYIMLTCIQAGIMFNSFVVVECLYLIHWKSCKNMGRGWNRQGEKRLPVLVSVCESVCHSCETVGQTGSNMETYSHDKHPFSNSYSNNFVHANHISTCIYMVGKTGCVCAHDFSAK